MKQPARIPARPSRPRLSAAPLRIALSALVAFAALPAPEAYPAPRERPAEEELERTALLGADFVERGADAFGFGDARSRAALLDDLLALGRPGEMPDGAFGDLLPRGSVALLLAVKELAEGRPSAALARAAHPERGGAAAGALHFVRALALLTLDRADEALEAADAAVKGMPHASEANALAASCAHAAGDAAKARSFAARAGRAAPKLPATVAAAAKPADPAARPPAAKPPADPFADKPVPPLLPFALAGEAAGREVAIGVSTQKGSTIGRTSLRVRGEGVLAVVELSGGKPKREELAAGRAHELNLGKDGKLHVDGSAKRALRLPVEIRAPRGGIYLAAIRFGVGYPWQGAEARLYRGTIRLEKADGGFRIINRIAMERYLAGVLPAEMPATSPVEALKAQAVAARSEALHKMGRHAKHGYDLCDDVCCQAYRGAGWERPRTNEAVEATRGVIMTHGGKAIDAVYGACCGGHAQSSAHLTGWGARAFLTGRPDRADGKDGGPFAFLRDAPGDFCAHAGAQYRWFRILPEELFAEPVREKQGLAGLERLIPVKRNPSGHLEKIALFDGARRAVVERELKIRDAFTFGHVRSGKFLPVMIEGKRARFLVLLGAGFGHGVGMCQEGAIGRANAGQRYRDILAHYYPEARFESVE